MEKQCSVCKQVKPLTEFAFRNRDKNYRQAYCRKPCSAEIHRHYYQLNKVAHDRAALQRKNKIKSDSAQRILKYLKAHACVDCGEPDPIVLDFDHMVGVKVNSIAQLHNQGRPWRVIEAEIEKCVVRCSNCHRRRTAAIQGYWKVRTPR